MRTLYLSLGRPVSKRELAAARWELFLFHEIKDVVASEPTVVAIVHDADEPRTSEWLAALAALGYPDVAVVERPVAC